MFDWMNSISGFFETIWTFLENLINSLVKGIALLTMSTGFPYGIIKFMPVMIGTAMTLFITIGIIKFILGR